MPPVWRGRTEDSLGDGERKRLGTLAPRIKAKMTERGTAMIAYQELDKSPNFFRMVVLSPTATAASLAAVLDEIETVGDSLASLL